MSSPRLSPAWRVFHSRFPPAIAALMAGAVLAAGQPAPASSAETPGYLSTTSGGLNNTASGIASTVGGGFGNTASGYFATIGGGFGNVAAGMGSFVAGTDAINDTSDHIGVFLFADNSGSPFRSARANEFAARATGGVRFVLGVDATGAPTWSCAAGNGSGWACSSDRTLKENFEPVDAADVLRHVAALPLYRWNAKGTDPRVKHLGPTAQDFMAAFALGSSDRMIGMQDAEGVALAAIQGLNELVEAQRQELAEQKQKIATLEAGFAQLGFLRGEIAGLKQELATLREGRRMPVAQR